MSFLNIFRSLDFFMIFRFFDFSIFDYFDSAPTQAGECAQHTTGIWALVARGVHVRSGGIQSQLLSDRESDLHKPKKLLIFTVFMYVRESRTLQCEEILTNGLL